MPAPELDKRRLGDVVDLFSNIKMLAAGKEKDLLGRVYEYCLQKFASMEGKNAGDWQGWWEFPGGKMEVGETPEEALKREIREELSTDINVDKFVCTVEYD